MAGEGSRRAHCEALIRARGLQARVHLLGYVEDVRSFYAACDIVTLPSRSEGLVQHGARGDEHAERRWR